MQNANVKLIRSSKKNLFTFWLNFLKPYHKLAGREMEALSILLYYRHELSMEISNPDLVDKLLFSSDTRARVRADLGGMKNGVFNNLLTVLRRKKALTRDNKITPGLIPMMAPDDTGFKLIFNFEMNEIEHGRQAEG